MKIIKLTPRYPFSGFVSLFNNKTKNFNDFIQAYAETNPGWATPDTLLNYSTRSQWVSPNSNALSHVIFHFSCPICLSHYTLRTRTDFGAENSFPVSWNVQTSLDNNTYTIVDTRTDREELKKIYDSYTYGVDSNCNYTNFIKINLTKTTTTGRYHFHISRVDFFGEMNFDTCKVPFRVGQNTCMSRRRSTFNIFVMIMKVIVS